MFFAKLLLQYKNRLNSDLDLFREFLTKNYVVIYSLQYCKLLHNYSIEKLDANKNNMQTRTTE